MALDYSKFDGIGSSDSEKGFGMPAMPDSPRSGDSAQESPRESLRRAMMAKQAGQVPAASRSLEVSDAPPSVTEFSPEQVMPALDRFVALAEGAEAQPQDDTFEILATVRAAAESAVAAGQFETPQRLVRAMLAGLSADPPGAFAVEQAPELIGVVLSTSGSGMAADDCEQVLALIRRHCSPKEVYTFLLSALCDVDLPWACTLRGVDFLKETLLVIARSKRHMFLGSCFQALLRRFTLPSCPKELMEPKLATLRSFAEAFVECSEDSLSDQQMRVTRSMAAAFLFKLLQRSYALVDVQELVMVQSQNPQVEGSLPLPRLPGGGPQDLLQRVRLQCAEGTEACLPSLCTVAREGARVAERPLLAMLEEIDLGDPTGDGGGDLEVSPLCLASWLCLLEVHCCWRELQPQILPIGISPARRVNPLMRAVLVLVSNRDELANVVDLEDLAIVEGSEARRPSPRWALRGLALFAQSAAPALHAAAAQTPEAFSTLTGPLCKWHPARVFQALLEALAGTPDIDREVRGSLFRTVAAAMRVFAWPCRFELYLSLLRNLRMDSVMGPVVTLAKEDLWKQVSEVSQRGAPLNEERAQLSSLLRATLAGDLQIIDGMDTLMGALNLCRLVALARAPIGPFLRAGLRKDGPGVDLDMMLSGVSKQIDIEMNLLAAEADGGHAESVLANELTQQLRALGGGGETDMADMKRDRITMVAHLVARVRELLAEVQD